jgi:hypothetical protein
MKTTDKQAEQLAEDLVWSYRFAESRGSKAVMARLRKVWELMDGEDSLHEMGFGEPIDRAALRERIRHTKRELGLPTTRRGELEAELAWLATVETV